MFRNHLLHFNANRKYNFLFAQRYINTVAIDAKASVDKEWNSAKPYDQIPAPMPLPIIGNTWRLGRDINILKLCIEMRAKYGDIVNMQKLYSYGDTIFLFNVQDIEWVLRNDGPWPLRKAFESTAYYRHVMRKDLFGTTFGLLDGQNEAWGKVRTVVNPILMQPRTTHQYIPQINLIADEFIKKVHKLKRNDVNSEMPNNFITELYKWAFESITAIALDTRLGCLDAVPSEKAHNAIKYVNEMFNLFVKLDLLPFGKYHRMLNTPTWQRFIECQDYLTNMVLDLIKEADQRIKRNPNPEHEKSVFEKLVEKDKTIALVMVADMMQAGVDTTSNSIGATLYLLAKSPEAQDKLRAELKRLLPHKDTPLTKTILDDAKYLRACIKESLRMAPIAVGNFRQSSKPLVIRGYQVPAGTSIFMANLYLSSVAKEHYSNPDKYIPERWLKNVEKEYVNAFVSMPFGHGARSCIGKRMASMEIEVLVSKMVRNFHLEWKHRDMTFKQNLIYGVADPLKLKLTELPN